MLRVQLSAYSEEFTEGLDYGLTALTIVWCVLNRISLLSGGAVSGYGRWEGSCEQAVNTILYCEPTQSQIRAV